MTRAKIFDDGGSQAVRLPQSCRVPDGVIEVIVRRDANRIILEAVDEWTPEFLSCLGAWDEEIPRPKSADEQRDPFE